MRFVDVRMLDDYVSGECHYDLAVFASGFEYRSTYLALKLPIEMSTPKVVLGFPEGSDMYSRIENDRIFRDEVKTGVEPVSTEIGKFIIPRLIEERGLLAAKGPIRILVDYSVMTRTWYGELLSWAGYLKHCCAIEIDFAYAGGKYSGQFDPLVIREIVPLLGFEGSISGRTKQAAIFSLGYDRYASLAVYDRLEPDLLVCCVAMRHPNDSNSQVVRAENAVLVEGSKFTFDLPLYGVADSFRLISDYLDVVDTAHCLSLVPMGPKTHILASLLVGLRRREVTCLHPRGFRHSPNQVVASGEVSVCRVTFEPEMAE